MRAQKSADLPVRAAAPVDFVRTCPNAPIGGQGFFVIPGTETCLRVSGYVRADYAFAEGRQTEGLNTRPQNVTGFWARGRVNFDARTNTDLGVLRSFIRLQGDAGDNGFVIANDDDDVAIDQAFIQFGGLTAGRITSFFDFYAFGDLMSIAAFNSDTTTELLAYTATFGNGFSATLSLESSNRRNVGLTEREAGTTVTIPAGSLFPFPPIPAADFDITNGATGPDVFVHGGQELPDLVANLNVTQAWGSAQIMAALRQIRHDGGADGSASFVNVDDEIGFAIGAGIEVLLPMIAAGDNIWFTATYAKGALGYIAPFGDEFTTQQIGVSDISDAYLNATRTGLSLTEAWAIAGGFTHFWTPTIWQSINASYGEVDVPNGAFGVLVDPGVGGTVGIGAQDYSAWNIGTRLNWRPAEGITFSADVGYQAIHTDYLVATDGTGVAGDDEDGQWAGRFRIQRDF